MTVIRGKRFYVNLSHFVLMVKLHARNSSVNIFILKKFYGTEERKSHCCSLIHVFLSRKFAIISFKVFRKRKGLSSTILNMSQMAGHLQVTHLPRWNRWCQSHLCTWDVLTHEVCTLPFQPAAIQSPPDNPSQHLSLKCPSKTDRKHRSYNAPSEKSVKSEFLSLTFIESLLGFFSSCNFLFLL